MNKLIVFTRYPVPGKAKTRLIPAVGKERAADIQRTMTEQTVATARSFAAKAGDCSIEIWFFGGSRAEMSEWLGDDLSYVEQPDGDLGHKMSEALSASFNAGAKLALIIGTDCPSITVDILEQAFEALAESDVVLGPAHDGGYYLMGQSQYAPALFRDIDWGTSSVFAETVNKASSAGLSQSLLPKLHDIDTPDDLELPEGQRLTTAISVIIPALNESRTIARVIEAAKHSNPYEIIVVDGGSTDGTPDIAEALGANVISANRGRARQLNAGAAQATGNALLFLHADTILPDRYDEHVRTILAQADTACGAFELKIDSHSKAFRLLELLVSFRSCVMCMPYGDQALFVRKDTFQSVNGFKDMRLMEDYDFVKRIRRQGSVVIADAAVNTSARRWEKLGILRTTMINQYMIAAYTCGVSPDRLAEIYARKRGATS